MWDKNRCTTECYFPTVCGPRCSPKVLSPIAPVRGNAMMMPTIAGGKNMCVKPSLACGVYVNPTQSCREPYIYKKSSKEQSNTQKPKVVCPPPPPPPPPPPKTTKQPGLKCAKPQSVPADLCAPKAKLQNQCSKPLGPKDGPSPKSVEICGCCSLKPGNPDLPSGSFPCKVTISQTKQQQQPQQQPQQQRAQKQSSPLSRTVCPCDIDKPKCESPRNKIKHSPSRQPTQQPTPKASPACSPAQKKQQSPCGSSQKDVLTISINCSVSDKTNSMQLCVSENPKPEENEKKQEDCNSVRK